MAEEYSGRRAERFVVNERYTMKMYFSRICEDCRQAEQLLAERRFCYDAVDITANTANLKEFLHLRDTQKEFKSIKEEGKIGIPCSLFSDGSILFDVNGLDASRLQADREEGVPSPGICGPDGC